MTTTTDPTPAPDSAPAGAQRLSPWKNRMINALLVAASLSVAYGIAEIFFASYENHLLNSMGVYIPTDPSVDGAAWDVDPCHAERFRWQADGSSLVHIKSPNPKLVYEIRPNASISDMIKINAAGFRDGEFSETKGEGVFRIVVIGDSVTFGWLQRLEDIYPKQLERLLNQSAPPGRVYEVYNMGVGGYNAEQELELLKTKAMKYHPDLLILGYCSNDGMIGYDGGLWRHFSRGSSRTLDFLKLKWMQYREQHSAKSMLVRSYEEIAAITRQAGIPVLVVLFPYSEDREGAHGKEHSALFSQMGLKTLDLFDAYQKAGFKNALADIVHPTVLGHQIAAQEIDRFLTGQMLPQIVPGR